jgi:hypothetical protein
MPHSRLWSGCMRGLQGFPGRTVTPEAAGSSPVAPVNLAPVAVLRSRSLWVVVAAGLAIRVALAFVFTGNPGHALIEAVAGQRVRAGAWHAVYESGFTSWTYPPLFLGWLAGASWLSDATGLSFHGLAKLGPVLADVGLAFAVYVYLGWRAASERTCLAGASLVMLGPSFIAVSGYHGQIDSVAILPAVLGLMAWERRPKSRRAIEAGVLIGLGAAVKLPPLLLVLALLGSASSWTERAKLVGAAVAVPALCFAPLWASGIDVGPGIRYTGVAGWGGLSLVVHPSLAWDRINLVPVADPGAVSVTVRDASRWITAVVCLAYSGFVLRYRPAPIDAAVLLWLAIFAFSPNFFLNYLVWGLPFFIMAGYLAEVAVLQAALLPPTLAYYLALHPVESGVLPFAYVPFMFGLWLFWVAATFLVAARLVRQRESQANGVQPPLVRSAEGGA